MRVAKVKNTYPNRFLARSILAVARKVYFERVFDIEVTVNETKGLEPPYLLLANHVNTWDPGLVNLYVDEPIVFVAADVWFIRPIYGRLMKMAGAIPKTKNKSDYQTIKRIVQACKDGKVVGIFPEGKRSWDGHTHDLFFSTSKLIKMLKVPVVTAVIKGGCLTLPRWASDNRRGRIELSYRRILDPDEIKSLSASEIHDRVTRELAHDEYGWQRTAQHVYSSATPAEHLEYFLYACPSCASTGTMISAADRFSCSRCGYAVRYTEQGIFEGEGGEAVWTDPRQWNVWQLGLLDDIIIGSGSPLMEDSGASYHIGRQGGKITPYLHGEVSTDSRTLTFRSDDGGKTDFPIDKIDGLNVKWNDQFEFYYEDRLHRFLFDGRVSTYKWVRLLEKLQERLKKTEAGNE